MKLLVCISKVPDTTAKIAFTDNNTKFNETGVQYIINPYDEYPYVDNFNYNIHNCTMGTTNILKNGGYKLEFNQSWADNLKNKKGYFGDKFQFACEKLWWLRNRGEYKAKVREL